MNACPLCGRRADDVHEDCLAALDSRLLLIPVLYAQLVVALEPGSSVGTRVSCTRTPPLPLSLEPLWLQCRGGLVSILGTWETDWRERLGLPLNRARAGREQVLGTGPALADIVWFLRTVLAWAVSEHPAIDEFATEVIDIIRACRATLGDVLGHMRIGRCPAQLGDRTCGRVLYADPYAASIRCDRCRTEWPRARWLLLGAAIAQGDAA
jgi:hypothetical protein